MLLKQVKMFCICYLIIPITCDLVAWSWVSDAASSYQLSLQDPAAPTMEGIFLFNFTEFKQSSVSVSEKKFE
jgi:hypothetical protein